jgi:FixJ family two-component response regulator
VEFAIDTYEINSIVDFIKKPVNEERLIKAIDKALNRHQTSNSMIEKNYAFIKIGRQAMKFDFEDIDLLTLWNLFKNLQ